MKGHQAKSLNHHSEEMELLSDSDSAVKILCKITLTFQKPKKNDQDLAFSKKIPKWIRPTSRDTAKRFVEHETIATCFVKANDLSVLSHHRLLNLMVISTNCGHQHSGDDFGQPAWDLIFSVCVFGG